MTRGIGLRNLKAKHSKDVSPYFTQYYLTVGVTLAETNLQFIAVSNRSAFISYSLVTPHDDVSITSDGYVTIGPFSTGTGDINSWFLRQTSIFNSWLARVISGSSGSDLTEFTVRANDGISYTDTTCNVNIVYIPPPNHAPVWSPSIAALQVPTNGQIDISGYASDQDGDTLSFALTGVIPNGYSITSAGVLHVNDTSANITIRVSDGVLSTDASCAVTVTAGGMIYETYANPFTADSIWNLPIQPTAQFTPMNFNPNDLVWTGDAPLPCNRFSASDPLVTVYRKINYLGTVGDVNNIDFNTIKCVMRIPNSYVAENQITDGGKFAFVMPDAAGAYYSGGSAIPYAAGDVQEMYAFERVAGRNYAAASFMSVLPHSIRGNGRPLNGQQGGSGMSAYGGLIRSGELTSPVGVDIPHALKFDMSATWLYYNAGFTETSIEGRGWIWPADRDDSFASSDYRSSNPLAKMGRLYALHPSFNTNSMQLEITRKIARALQVYGGYPVDATGPTGTNTKLFYTEAVNYSNKTVRNEVYAAYGINMNYLLMTGAGLSGNSLMFLQDIKTIMANLHAVTNATPSTPKG